MITKHLSFGIVALVFAQQPNGLAPLTPAEFKKLHAEIVPKEKECWEKIAWKIDLFEARAIAYKTKKPIFLWAMNGHPLGCT
jgi:hypothetical protein